MEPETRYTWIGAVVLALLLGVGVSLAWLSGAGRASDFRNFTIYFERQSLQGLQIGSDVNMRGVKVGRVEDFGIDRENINRVSVVVRVARLTPVSTNTEAVVNRNLVTGIARIDLETPKAPGPELIGVADGERYPIIGEGRGDLDQIAESANSMIISAETALRNVNLLLSPDNQASINGILAGLRDTALNMDARLASFETAAGQIGQTADVFRSSAQELSQAIEQFRQGVAPAVAEALRVMTDMQVTLRQITSAARTMDTSTASLASRAADAADVGVIEMRATAQGVAQRRRHVVSHAGPAAGSARRPAWAG
ncbi:MAG: MlaD family protein [Burkholderiaceae bacterium]